MTQISTSVPQTMEVVVLMPPVQTLQVASHVPVHLDTTVMDSAAQVSLIKIHISFDNVALNVD